MFVSLENESHTLQFTWETYLIVAITIILLIIRLRHSSVVDQESNYKLRLIRIGNETEDQ